MPIDYQALGRRIRGYRRQKQLSQSRMAEMIDRSPTYVSYLENGIKHPSLETLVEIANALGVTADMLLGKNLEQSESVAEEEYQKVLRDCDTGDRWIIVENAKALKHILRDARRAGDT